MCQELLSSLLDGSGSGYVMSLKATVPMSARAALSADVAGLGWRIHFQDGIGFIGRRS